MAALHDAMTRQEAGSDTSFVRMSSSEGIDWRDVVVRGAICLVSKLIGMTEIIYAVISRG